MGLGVMTAHRRYALRDWVGFFVTPLSSQVLLLKMLMPQLVGERWELWESSSTWALM